TVRAVLGSDPSLVRGRPAMGRSTIVGGVAGAFDADAVLAIWTVTMDGFTSGSGQTVQDTHLYRGRRRPGGGRFGRSAERYNEAAPKMISGVHEQKYFCAGPLRLPHRPNRPIGPRTPVFSRHRARISRIVGAKAGDDRPPERSQRPARWRPGSLAAPDDSRVPACPATPGGPATHQWRRMSPSRRSRSSAIRWAGSPIGTTPIAPRWPSRRSRPCRSRRHSWPCRTEPTASVP